MTQRKVRVAMLGTGFIAGFRAEVYARIEGAELVAVLGRDLDKARAFAAKHGVAHAASSWEELIAGSDFEAIDLCLPNHLHEAFALKAAAAGKHMLCEKPLGRNATEARAMLAAAEAAGVVHVYGENMIHSPDFREIISLIGQDVIGRPLWLRGREAHFGPHSDWFWKKELSGGGALIDMGCHLIAIFNLILGQAPEQVFAHAPTLHHDTDCEDNVVALLRYPGGAVGQCEASWTQRGGMAVDFEALGDDGMITYDRSGLSQPIKLFTRSRTQRYISEKVEHDRGWLFPTVDEYWRYGYYDQIRHFVACLRDGATPLLTFADGLMVNRIMDAAYAAAESGTWQPLPP